MLVVIIDIMIFILDFWFFFFVFVNLVNFFVVFGLFEDLVVV